MTNSHSEPERELTPEQEEAARQFGEFLGKTELTAGDDAVWATLKQPEPLIPLAYNDVVVGIDQAEADRLRDHVIAAVHAKVDADVEKPGHVNAVLAKVCTVAVAMVFVAAAIWVVAFIVSHLPGR